MFEFSEKKRGVSPNPLADRVYEERPQQSFSVDSGKHPRKQKLGMLIDTESINDMFNFGGEKGKKWEIDEDEFQKELDAIRDLAAECVRHMQGHAGDYYRSKMPNVAKQKDDVPMTTKNRAHGRHDFHFKAHLGERNPRLAYP